LSWYDRRFLFGKPKWGPIRADSSMIHGHAVRGKSLAAKIPGIGPLHSNLSTTWRRELRRGQFITEQRTLVLEPVEQHKQALLKLGAAIPDLRRSLSQLDEVSTSSALASALAGFQRLLDPNGTVLALSGRRIDSAIAEERRFPPENEAIVAIRIRNIMVSAAGQAVVCSAACGADILALESAAQLGLDRRVVLPFPRQQFRATSVADRGEEWGRRFDAILEQIPSKDILELNLQGGNNDAYATANSKIIDEAADWASTTGRRALAMVVWNGVSRGPTDMTDGFRKLAVDRELEVIPVPTL
jgi:hypothetical protein